MSTQNHDLATRDELLKAIAQEEARLARLQAEQAETRQRLAALRAEAELAQTQPKIHMALPVLATASVPQTPPEKVKLFRSLFLGRADVFTNTLREQENWQGRLRTRVCEQVREGRVRPAQDQMRRVP